MRRGFLIAALCVALGGCGTDYCWRSSVPEDMRTISVPTFRNESDVAELGAIASRQVLREIQREGTFKIRTADDSALEVQGVIKSAKSGVNAYDRRTGMFAAAYGYEAVAEVSVVDRRKGRVLMDNRVFTAHADFTATQDLTTARRDASGRLMEDLARQVVDSLLGLKW